MKILSAHAALSTLLKVFFVIAFAVLLGSVVRAAASYSLNHATSLQITEFGTCWI
ncbi:MAG: hypothetical protein HZA81_04510, partial [Candidatus Taylorbacteria bacterium]|nr:hypothetical protein [Candidatus Taylorbacteria bacterium]